MAIGRIPVLPAVDGLFNDNGRFSDQLFVAMLYFNLVEAKLRLEGTRSFGRVLLFVRILR